jgi:hypothetical protein
MALALWMVSKGGLLKWIGRFWLVPIVCDLDEQIGIYVLAEIRRKRRLADLYRTH